MVDVGGTTLWAKSPPAPSQNQVATAARLLQPASLAADPAVSFGLIAFAKSDIVVRRNHVWGLKPRFLEALSSPFREVLEKGRTGSFETRLANR